MAATAAHLQLLGTVSCYCCTRIPPLATAPQHAADTGVCSLQYASPTRLACGQASLLSRNAAASRGESGASSEKKQQHILALPHTCKMLVAVQLKLWFMFCSVPAKAAVSSADGTKLAAVTDEGVDVYATADSSKVTATVALNCISSCSVYAAHAVQRINQQDGCSCCNSLRAVGCLKSAQTQH